MTVPMSVWITVRVIAIEPEYNYLPHSTCIYKSTIPSRAWDMKQRKSEY